MFMNAHPHPTVEVLVSQGHAKFPEPVSVPLVEVYPGAKRCADGKSVSVISSYLSEQHTHELPPLDLYNSLFGDRNMIIEQGFTGWLDATERSNAVGSGNRMPFVGAVSAFRQRLADESLGKYVSDFIALVPLNDVGKAAHMLENLRQKIHNYEATTEYEALAGGKPIHLERISVNLHNGRVYREGQIAGVDFDRKGVSISKDYAKMVNALAAHYDVPPEIIDLYFMIHELGEHLKREVDSESELEAHIHEFFEKLASKEFDGDVITVADSHRSKKARYKDIAGIAEQRFHEVRINYGSRFASLFAAHFNEAVEKGYDAVEAADYAQRIVEEEAAKERSGKDSKDYTAESKEEGTDAGESESDGSDAEEAEADAEETEDADSSETDAEAEEGEGAEGESAEGDGE